jgi:hypothetical protein
MRSLRSQVDRLDEDKIDMLRRWGDGLQADSREELRAAGRAILLLIEEIERLHVELWRDRPEPAYDEALEGEPEVDSSLLSRLRHLGRRREELATPPQ